jgi:hypothetical protein
MINLYNVKKWVALIMSPLLTTLMFFLGFRFYNMLWGMSFLFAGVLLFSVLANFMIKNPFSSMIEGKGLLALNIDSTGIIKPFIVGLSSPYIKGRLGKQEMRDVFNRDTILQIAPAKKNKHKVEYGDGKIKIVLDEKQYNQARFAMLHYPTLIWNDQIKSIVTKDFLAEGEKTTFAEHGVLYLNRQMEGLTSVVRDFGRYVVELTKPKDSFLKSKWVMIILIVFIIIMAILFLPKIMQTLAPSWSAATQGIGGMFQGETVIPAP